MTTHQALAPQAVADYFGIPRKVAYADRPMIHGTFVPGRGWKGYGFRKAISQSWARNHLRAEGVTEVSIAYGGRVADFRIQELTR